MAFSHHPCPPAPQLGPMQHLWLVLTLKHCKLPPGASGASWVISKAARRQPLAMSPTPHSPAGSGTRPAHHCLSKAIHQPSSEAALW